MKVSWRTSHGTGNSGIFISPLQSRLRFPDLYKGLFTSQGLLTGCSTVPLRLPQQLSERWGKNPWPLHACIFHASKTSTSWMQMLSMAARVGWTLTLQNHVVVWGIETTLGLCLSQVESLAGWSLFLRTHVHCFSI